jgi:hypothetical protein
MKSMTRIVDNHPDTVVVSLPETGGEGGFADAEDDPP